MPICNEKLIEIKSTPTQCCENPEIINDKHIVCTNCGSVHCQLLAREFIDFYENKYKFCKMSIYIRKYHLLNQIDILRNKFHVDIDLKTGDKILRVFKIIVPDIQELNQNRKRMICTKFIIRNLSKFMKMEHFKIPITKSKKLSKTISNIGIKSLI